MTTFLLIRHAAHDLLGKTLVGRAPGVALNSQGEREAAQLAERLARAPLRAVYTSPRERARQTAQPLAERLGLEVQIEPAFDEIDFGEWTSASFAELEGQPLWQAWNEARDRAQPPQGETMAAAQRRIAEGLEFLAHMHQGQVVAIVSHGDIIKAALMHFLRIPLNHIAHLEIHPASLSSLEWHGEYVQVTRINSQVDDPLFRC